MASNVSPTAAFNPAASFIIEQALRTMAVINEDEVPGAGQYKTGMFTLNAMMKMWEATGIHIWTEEEGILFLQQGQRMYRLGGTTTDKACNALQWIQTKANQAAASGSTSVVVLSAEGLAVTDNFGVILNSGAIFWTTIAGISGTTITLTDALTSPISAQTFVASYPVAAQLERPLQIPFARRLLYQTQMGQVPGQAPDWGGIITSISPQSARQDFMDLPQPNNPGTPTQYFYNPARDQGEFWIWNVPQNAGWAMRFTYYRSIRDFLYGNNTGDFPQEWVNPVMWLLAKELSLSYSVPPTRWSVIKEQAEAMYETVATWDREAQSVYFGRTSRYQR